MKQIQQTENFQVTYGDMVDLQTPLIFYTAKNESSGIFHISELDNCLIAQKLKNYVGCVASASRRTMLEFLRMITLMSWAYWDVVFSVLPLIWVFWGMNIKILVVSIDLFMCYLFEMSHDRHSFCCILLTLPILYLTKKYLVIRPNWEKI